MRTHMGLRLAGMLGAVASAIGFSGPTPGHASQTAEAKAIRGARRGSARKAPAHIVAARLAAAQAKRDRRAARLLAEAAR